MHPINKLLRKFGLVVKRMPASAGRKVGTIEEGKDYSLTSGERQVASSLTEIRRDHLLRYQLAHQILTGGEMPDGPILDCFCGNGYGTSILSGLNAERITVGIDASKEAIRDADKHYRRDNTWFILQEYPFMLPKNAYAALVCFESIEHISEYKAFMKTLCDSIKPGGILLLSTPNEETMPLGKNTFDFHFRHFRPAEVNELLAGHDMTLVKVWGQDTYNLQEGRVMATLPPDKMDLIEGNLTAQFQIYWAIKAK